MKDTICFIDSNEYYVKKLNNYAIKKYGKKYLFLYFSNIKSIIDYTEENKVKCVVLSNDFEKDIKSLNSSLFYVQTDNKNIDDKIDNIRYVYKYQDANILLNKIDNDIENNIKKSTIIKPVTKIIAFYSPYQSKIKKEILNKIQKMISIKKDVVRVNFDEYDNYMGNIGLSNIIYKSKENLLTNESIDNEIENIDGMKIIKSVSYPEDFSVVNNIELASIVSDFKNAEYNYIFLDLDTCFIKNQYIFIECDKLFVFDGDEENKKTDIFIKYIEQQNAIDMKKMYRFEKGKFNNDSMAKLSNMILNL